MRYSTSTNDLLRIVSTGLAALAVAFATVGPGCSDTTATNAANEANHNGDNDGPNADNTGNQNDNDNSGQNNNDDPSNGDNHTDPLDCPAGEPTTLSGTVYIPSGQLPLPGATVYIPEDEPGPLPEGVSCQQCTDMLTATPAVETTTDHQGEFELEHVPETSDVPLVVRTGKWRRQVEIDTVDACEDNTVDAPDKLRLPAHHDEGNLPQLAVTSGSSDALQCLIDRIGVDRSEFTTPDGDGRVHVFDGGGSSGFADEYNDGVDFPPATDWWDDFEGIDQYDLVLFSCHYDPGPPEVSTEAAEAMEQYADQGGRIFMTDQQKVWLSEGTDDFQSVAQWREHDGPYDRTAFVETSFSDGKELSKWLEAVDGLTHPASNTFPAVEIWDNVVSLDRELTRQWVYTMPGGDEQTAYFDFNTPVGADSDQQCGRVVYSDLHIASAGPAHPHGRFPDNCGDPDAELSSQEKALIYMLFDLSGCVVPECEPKTCRDLYEPCGVHDDGCDGTIECECCVEKGESCEEDFDCCRDLWCDDEAGTYECTDRCRQEGERCTEDAHCCSDSCAIPTGQDEGECVTA